MYLCYVIIVVLFPVLLLCMCILLGDQGLGPEGVLFRNLKIEKMSFTDSLTRQRGYL